MQRKTLVEIFRVATITAWLHTMPAIAHADALQVVNVLRTSVCSHRLDHGQLLTSNAKLAKAGEYVHRGLALRDALKRAEYRADKSAVIEIGGTAMSDETLSRMLAKNSCATLTDPGLIEVGISRSGNAVALIFAAPFTPPASSDARLISVQVLKLVNEARAKPRKCGRKNFRAAAPLTSNDLLLKAATLHAKDMAASGVMSHTGSDGSSADERATRAGYTWRAVGENVAAGQLTAHEVVAGWLASPGHCENIMNAEFTQMAVAYMVNTKQAEGIYWAQEFGRPR